nr:MAG TPA: hypothetical protein [Caudoviricetes sp.]
MDGAPVNSKNSASFIKTTITYLVRFYHYLIGKCQLSIW